MERQTHRRTERGEEEREKERGRERKERGRWGRGEKGPLPQELTERRVCQPGFFGERWVLDWLKWLWGWGV